MSAVPAARHLADFGADGNASALRANAASIKSDTTAAAKLDEAFARGIETGRAEAQAEFRVKLEELRGEFAEQLAGKRQEWAAGAGAELANRLLTALTELEKRVAETTARILKPFLAAELHRQAVAELQGNLEALLATDAGFSMNISGPADILDALRQQLSGRTNTVTYTPSDDCDVRIVAGQATLETQLKSWLAKLEEATR